MPSGVLAPALRALGAHDPARARLRKTLSVTTGILLSVLWGYGVIHVLHADSGLLTISMFLSLIAAPGPAGHVYPHLRNRGVGPTLRRTR